MSISLPCQLELLYSLSPSPSLLLSSPHFLRPSPILHSSPFSSPSPPHQSHLPGLSDEFVVLVTTRDELFASACAIARVFPEYNMKTSAAPTQAPRTVTVEVNYFAVLPSSTLLSNCVPR